ncbi:uncharacterized protein LOC106664175 [Cimex lectularius]|uniref:C2H2-type domain-containing protein n=1 Tax=Cimex lectularius TaxID=79782 RepID=A0A8I6SPJ3_CIMLE|nr:uncharacterized protein LOC106664175 [Cimex lectularius]
MTGSVSLNYWPQRVDHLLSKLFPVLSSLKKSVIKSIKKMENLADHVLPQIDVSDSDFVFDNCEERRQAADVDRSAYTCYGTCTFQSSTFDGLDDSSVHFLHILFHMDERILQKIDAGLGGNENRLIKPPTEAQPRMHTGRPKGLASTSGVNKDRHMHFCAVCRKGFKDRYALKVHFRIHTGEKPFICQICARGFSQKAHLLKHREIHVRRYLRKTAGLGLNPTAVLPNGRIVQDVKNHLFNCCPQRFEHRLWKPFPVQSFFTEEIGNNVNTKMENLAENVLPQIDVNDSDFVYVNSEDVREVADVNNRAYTCYACDGMCTFRTDGLDDISANFLHVLFHMDERILKTIDAGLGGNDHRHIKPPTETQPRMHTGRHKGLASTSGVKKDRYMHFCAVCQKGFKDRYALKVHFRIHTGEKPFVCEICARGFSQKAHLLKHKEIHMDTQSSETKERPPLLSKNKFQSLRGKSNTTQPKGSLPSSSDTRRYRPPLGKPKGKKKVSAELPKLGEPGGKDDPLRKGLSGAMTKWYLRAIKSGKTPEEAMKLADERKAKIQKEKLEAPSSSKRASEQSLTPKELRKEKKAKPSTPQAQFKAREAASSVSYAGAAKIIRVALLPEEYPLFEGIHFRPGMMVLDCQDGKTVQWLQEIAPKLELNKEKKLTVRVGEDVPKPHSIAVFFPRTKLGEEQRTLALVKAQNDGICAEEWKVHSVKAEGPGIVMILGIDDISAKTIMSRGHTLNFRFGRIPVRGLKKGGGEEDTKREKSHTSTPITPPSIQTEQAPTATPPPTEITSENTAEMEVDQIITETGTPPPLQMEPRNPSLSSSEDTSNSLAMFTTTDFNFGNKVNKKMENLADHVLTQIDVSDIDFVFDNYEETRHVADVDHSAYIFYGTCTFRSSTFDGLDDSSVHFLHILYHMDERILKKIDAGLGGNEIRHIKPPKYRHMHLRAICRKGFKERYALKEQHLRIHTGEKPFLCEICERGFSQKAHLLKHKEIHLYPRETFGIGKYSGRKDAKPRCCPTEGVFQIVHDVKNHLFNCCPQRFEHRLWKPFPVQSFFTEEIGNNVNTKMENLAENVLPQIDVNDSDFVYVNSEDVREVADVNNRAYTCYACDGMCTFRTDGLDDISANFLHVLFHMDERILKTIDAGLGGNDHRHIKPPTETQPRMHTGRHKGLASTSGVKKDRYMHFCAVCQKGFKDRYALKVHFRIHTGEKPFVCEICARGFSQKAHLLKHKEIHVRR